MQCVNWVAFIMWLVDFVFPYRLHRLAYFFRCCFLNAVAAVFYADCGPIHSNYWWAAIGVIPIYELFFVILPRVRDIRLNAWWVLICFVPVADIVFGVILLFRAPVYLRNEVAGKSELEPTSGIV
jgi:hypothetical protein